MSGTKPTTRSGSTPPSFGQGGWRGWQPRIHPTSQSGVRQVGGRINTDAIDNSAGVDCSDHEVDIKILLDAVVADGDLTVKQRNTLLEEMTDDVAHLVLRDNYRQTQALSNAAAQALPMVDVHVRYMRWLEQAGRLDRDLEGLPSDEALAERKAAGEGLTSPEFAVLLAYTKIELYEELWRAGSPRIPSSLRVGALLPGGDLSPVRRPVGRPPVAPRDHRQRHRQRHSGPPGDNLRLPAGRGDRRRSRRDRPRLPVARDVFDIRGIWAGIEALDDESPPGSRR